jgi:3-isopropylmalate dehydratase small subunit
MKPFTRLTGTAAPLPIANVDTDMIIPKQFLKTVSRDGLARGLFYELKTRQDGEPNPEFVLNQPAYAKASILIAKENFGCGSSREHAPWALLDQGLSCVIAPSFADIFYNNCFKNGLLPVVLPREIVEDLLLKAGGPNHVFTVDLTAQTVTGPDGVTHDFDIDPGRKAGLLAGLDDIGESLAHASSIEAFEQRRIIETPWLQSSQ